MQISSVAPGYTVLSNIIIGAICVSSIFLCLIASAIAWEAILRGPKFGFFALSIGVGTVTINMLAFQGAAAFKRVSDVIDKPIIIKQMKKWNLEKLEKAKSYIIEAEIKMKTKLNNYNNIIVKNLLVRLYSLANSIS